MFPDPLRLTVALAPIASYLALIGWINARRRPFLTTGGNDLATLGAACSGLIVVGPIELFRPEAASAQFGGYVWVFLLVFYWLWVWLAVLLARPRLVIYNVSGEELRPALSDSARRIDSQARWTGDSLLLPTLRVHLHVEPFEAMRHVSLISSGRNQRLDGWKHLARELRGELKQMQVRRNPRAVGLLLASTMLLALSIGQMVRRPAQVAQAIEQMLFF